MEILAYQPEGAFIVRSSTSSPGSFALSLKAPPGGRIVHYLIEQGPAGLRLQVYRRASLMLCTCTYIVVVL